MTSDVEDRIFKAFIEQMKAAGLIMLPKDAPKWANAAEWHKGNEGAVWHVALAGFPFDVISDKLGGIIEDRPYNEIDFTMEGCAEKFNFERGQSNIMHKENPFFPRDISVQELNDLLNKAIGAVFPQKAAEKTAVEKYVPGGPADPLGRR